MIKQLTDELSRLPGIGSKTALRLVHHLMKGSKEEAGQLSRAITKLIENIKICKECGNFSEDEFCEVCTNPARDRSVLCVVEASYEGGAI